MLYLIMVRGDWDSIAISTMIETLMVMMPPNPCALRSKKSDVEMPDCLDFLLRVDAGVARSERDLYFAVIHKNFLESRIWYLVRVSAYNAIKTSWCLQ